MGKRIYYNQLTKEDINNNLRNNQIEIVGEYINSKQKTKFKCLICGDIFESNYEYLKNATDRIGCSKCNQQRIKQQNHNIRYEKLLSKKSDYVEIINFVLDSNTIKCRCKLCNEIYETSYDSLIQGSKHKSCSAKIASKSSMLTDNDIRKRLSIINKDIEVDFSNYENSKVKVKCKCKVCNNEWFSYPKNLIQGRGCPVCAVKKRRETKKDNYNEFQHYLDINRLELLSEYNGATSEIKVKCMECGKEFNTNLSYIKQTGIGCTDCSENLRKRKKINIAEKTIHKINPHLHIIGDCSFDKVQTVIYCDTCKTYFEKPIHDLVKFPVCKNCNGNSNLESMLITYLNDENIYYESHKSFKDLLGVNGGKLTYDLYIPKYNLLIEAQGVQHEKPIGYFGGEEQFKIQQEHDKRKREYADNNNYDFLEIWYYQNAIDILKDKLQITNPTK